MTIKLEFLCRQRLIAFLVFGKRIVNFQQTKDKREIMNYWNKYYIYFDLLKRYNNDEIIK